MYKNLLQELAQRSCFNLPSYTCIREGPDHVSRFKATANFNGEIFESPSYSSTLRQAEQSVAEFVLGSLSHRDPSHSFVARFWYVLSELLAGGGTSHIGNVLSDFDAGIEEERGAGEEERERDG
ncbi:unnamed protein product [Linum trigynum]|uniref:DRBM domain-containing protein n=1 Tax=Linum trigynum TaxID=586398 RepID=A0AAV2G8P0_9ROSI